MLDAPHSALCRRIAEERALCPRYSIYNSDRPADGDAWHVLSGSFNVVQRGSTRLSFDVQALSPRSSFPEHCQLFLSIFKRLRYVFSAYAYNCLSVARRKRWVDEAQAVAGEGDGLGSKSA